jgi:hypothetical protein
MTMSRPRYLGHFEWTPGARRAEYAVPWQFSLPRDLLLRRLPWLLGAALAASAVWIVAWRWRGAGNGMLTTEVFLWLTAVSQGVIAVLGDGFFGLERHLILGRFAVDFLAATIVVDALYRLRPTPATPPAAGGEARPRLRPKRRRRRPVRPRR